MEDHKERNLDQDQEMLLAVLFLMRLSVSGAILKYEAINFRDTWRTMEGFSFSRVRYF